jgi:hypothetical protein
MKMAEQYNNENRFALFREENRKSDKHPEFSGTLNIDGTDYWINAWVQVSKSGKKFFSGTVRPKEAPRTQQSAPQRQKQGADDFGFDQDIPF